MTQRQVLVIDSGHQAFVPGENVVALDNTVTAAALVSAMADEATDVIELAGGTYATGTSCSITTARKRPLIVRPAAGATVTFDGSGLGGDGQFYFGLSGKAANITLQDFAFTGFTLGQTGIIWIGNAHDITANRMTVSGCTGSGPTTAWALYVSQLDDKGSANITADGWTVTGSSRSMSGAQVTQSALRSNIRMRGWTVSHLAYAFYASAYAEGLDVNDWAISDCGTSGIAVYFEAHAGQTLKGAFRNIVGTTSERIISLTTDMVDAGGNRSSAGTTPLYLHAATTAVSGSLPGSGGIAGDGDKSATGVNTNRVMDGSVGASETSVSIVSLGTTSTQNLRMARFISPPLAAQTISAQDIRLHITGAQSAVAAGVSPGFQLFLWRPSSGTKVGNIVTGPRDATPALLSTAKQNVVTNTGTSTSQTAVAGDVLVLEIWINGRQTDTSTYTDTLYYDGTLPDGTLSAAAYLDIPNGVTLL